MTWTRRAALPLLLVAIALSSCGGGLDETRPAATGNVSVALTDAPSYAFDNVWITVRAVWFHQVETAPFDPTATGWVRFTFAGDNTATVNLAALSGGAVRTLWDNLALAEGTYRQILLILEPTESALAPSASAKGLRFNNQVDAGTRRAALRVPNAAQGIRLAGSFPVAKGAPLRLAIDFDVARDVVPADRGGVPEFVLKPRLRSFDLGNAGAIVGFIDNASARDNAALFEVKAEQIDTALGVRVVRRAAAVDNATGRFVLYPLDPGSYDLVIRGIDYDTFIVRNVGPVVAGTTPSSSPRTFASRITMVAAPLPDYRVGAVVSPAGSWVLFYQALTVGDSVPYEIGVRHVDPFTGRFDNFPLSNGPIRAGAYNNGRPAFAVAGGGGTFTAVADAPLYARGGGIVFNSGSAGSDLPVVSPSAPNSRSISGTMTVQSMGTGVALDNGVVFIVHGGQILDKVSRNSADMAMGDHLYFVGGIPGAFAGAFYGVTALGWSIHDNVLAVASPAAVADLRSGNATVNLTMRKATGP